MNASEFLYKKNKQGFLLKAQKSPSLYTTCDDITAACHNVESEGNKNCSKSSQCRPDFSQSKVYCENIAAGPLLRVRSCGFMASGEMRAGARVEGRGKKSDKSVLNSV